MVTSNAGLASLDGPVCIDPSDHFESTRLWISNSRAELWYRAELNPIIGFGKVSCGVVERSSLTTSDAKAEA